MINFFNEAVDFDREDFQLIKNWIKKIAKNEGYEINYINYIFTNDEKLYEINKKYLNHNYYTDIITFPYNEKNYIEADIYISIERVEENAKELKTNFEKELLRVMIHGVLHIVGFKDQTEEEIMKMRKKEEQCLKIWNENAG